MAKKTETITWHGKPVYFDEYYGPFVVGATPAGSERVSRDNEAEDGLTIRSIRSNLGYKVRRDLPLIPWDGK